MRNNKLYVKDILAAIEAIEHFVENCDFEEFKKNDLVASAVVRKFEIIGEAAKNIPGSLLKKYPQIPWKEMAGMRDRLIHFYFGVKYDLVWNTIQQIIPSIKPALEKMFDDL